MNAAMDHAFWERVANGSPLIVLILMMALIMLWRYLVARQSAFDEALRAERDALRTMQVETLRALAAMQSSVDRNTEATRELTSAIRERAH
jgi:hypothetical protein